MLNDYGCGRNNSSSNSLYRALAEQLRRLDFATFHRTVFIWLGSKGYRHIHSLGRHSARGRRPIGGIDFVAEGGLVPVRIAVQVRHCRTPIQRRVVDEFRGVLLREGIPAGVIVSNGTFSAAATRVAANYPGRPIQLVPVARLAGSMAGLGLGVYPSRTGWRLDQHFFRLLDRLRYGSDFPSPDEDDAVVPRDKVMSDAPSPDHQPSVAAYVLLFIAVVVFGLVLHWSFGR